MPSEPEAYSLISPLSARLRTDIRVTVQACSELPFVLVPGWASVSFSAVWASISPRPQLVLS